MRKINTKFSIKLYIYCFSIIFIPSVLIASGPSSSSGIVLRIPFDAKNAALGNAGAAFSGQAGSIEVNPACLAYIKEANISAAHINVLSDIKMNGLLYSEPISKTSSFSVYAKSMRSGKILRTEIIDLTHYRITGQFSIKDSMLGIVFAQKNSKSWQILDKPISAGYGISFKYLNSQIADYKARAFSFDIGGYLKNNYSPFAFGLSILNFGNRLKYISEGDKQPLTCRFGISYNNVGNSNFIVSADIIKLSYTPIKFAFGIDYKFSKYFSVRSGYDSRNDAGLGYSVGFGLNMFILKTPNSHISIDYAYKPYEDIGDYHYLTATLKY